MPSAHGPPRSTGSKSSHGETSQSVHSRLWSPLSFMDFVHLAPSRYIAVGKLQRQTWGPIKRGYFPRSWFSCQIFHTRVVRGGLSFVPISYQVFRIWGGRGGFIVSPPGNPFFPPSLPVSHLKVFLKFTLYLGRGWQFSPEAVIFYALEIIISLFLILFSERLSL